MKQKVLHVMMLKEQVSLTVGMCYFAGGETEGLKEDCIVVTTSIKIQDGNPVLGTSLMVVG